MASHARPASLRVPVATRSHIRSRLGSQRCRLALSRLGHWPCHTGKGCSGRASKHRRVLQSCRSWFELPVE